VAGPAVAVIPVPSETGLPHAGEMSLTGSAGDGTRRAPAFAASRATG
jgi:hypothetical protein